VPETNNGNEAEEAAADVAYYLETTLVTLCLQRRKETPIEVGRRKVVSLPMSLGNGDCKRLLLAKCYRFWQ
jgi:hypothetical protein